MVLGWCSCHSRKPFLSIRGTQCSPSPPSGWSRSGSFGTEACGAAPCAARMCVGARLGPQSLGLVG